MVKEFKTEYLDEIMSIWLEGNITAHHFIPQTYWTQNYSEVKQMMPDAEIYVYMQDECVKGFIGISANHYISGLFVENTCRSVGIGTCLLNHVKDKYDFIDLDVYVENEKAVNFYSKNDFEIIREEKNLFDGRQEYRMVWNKNV